MSIFMIINIQDGFACQRKENHEHLCCHIRDDIHDILDGAFRGDGLVFATPIYFFDITAQLRAFLERLMYPGVSEKQIPTAFIYTMNAPEQIKEELNFEASLSTSKRFLESTFQNAPLMPSRKISDDMYLRRKPATMCNFQLTAERL
jgi:multimeric flavodoxin WrbA